MFLVVDRVVMVNVMACFNFLFVIVNFNIVIASDRINSIAKIQAK